MSLALHSRCGPETSDVAENTIGTDNLTPFRIGEIAVGFYLRVLGRFQISEVRL
jgi:hypothetical protein